MKSITSSSNFGNEIDKHLSEKRELFYHPYTPYDIQLQLMRKIYTTLEDGYKVGIFESPTGTGKTLSIICSTMSWLRNHRKRLLLNEESNKGATEGANNGSSTFGEDDDEPDWVKETYYNSFLLDTRALLEEYEIYLGQLKDEYKDIYTSQYYEDDMEQDKKQVRNPYEISGIDYGVKKKPVNENSRIKRQKIEIEIENDRDFLPDDYYDKPMDNSPADGTKSLAEKTNELNFEIKRMLKDMQHKRQNQDRSSRIEKLFSDELTANEGDGKTTIFFTSRTHSQLSQFAEQLTMTQFPSSVDNLKANERIKYVPMGSRKQLCINPKVYNLGNTSLINEACLDLQKAKQNEKKNAKLKGKDTILSPALVGSGCQYYQNYQNDLRTGESETVRKFRDLVLSKIHDIEDLGKIGQRFKICPYYSMKNSFGSLPEIVSLPYQLILDSDIRQQLNINIKNSIIIIDEAHNLIDTIVAINSVKITLQELQTVETNLNNYFVKFMRKLNSGNRINLLKLKRMLKNIIEFIVNFEKNTNKKIKNGLEVKTNDIFKDAKGGDLINIYSLEKYLKESKVAYKIENYLSKKDQQQESHSIRSKQSTPLLFKLIKFIKLITNPSKEGKLFFNIEKTNITTSSFVNTISLNYMLLNPVEIFREIIDDCKCVLLCGGTMEPIQDFTDFLFPYMDDSKFLTFSCDHIIPKENLSVMPIRFYSSSSPSTGSPAGSSQPFDFSFTNRNNQLMIVQLGYYISQLIQEIPHGVVIFFPSYKYLNDVIKIWTVAKSAEVWKLISSRKKIFFEPKDSKDVDSLLRSYSDHIMQGNSDCGGVGASNHGAILLSVVGGKVSEGINFSNELARGVIMIGLPYPNIFSGEIINKRNYIEETVVAKGGTKEQAKAKSMEFYENLCMKAVNQSIGRAIRNNKDYAIIYLFDQRYGSDRIQNKLSKWVRKKLVPCALDKGLLLTEVKQTTKGFFDYHRKK